MPIYAKVDCGLPRDPKLVAAGPMPRLLYVQFVLYCRENLTDGKVVSVLLPLVALDIPQAKKHVATLVTVGALEQCADGWCIPEAVWRKWNPTRAEVDDMRAAEAERKASWRDKNRRDKNVPTGHDVAVGTRDRQPEGETEGEGKREQEGVNPQQQQNRGTARLAAAERTSLLESTARLIADERGLRGKGNNPSAYFAAAVTGIVSEIHDQAHDLLSAHPDWTPTQLAHAIEHPPQAPRPSAFPPGWTSTLSHSYRPEVTL